MAIFVADFARRLQRVEPTADRDLLAAYLQRNSHDAFRRLVERHGPMVWRVCRQVLGHDGDAEDAFQATFLVLARRASSVSIRRPETLPAWLHAVARRIALKTRTTRARRMRREALASQRPTSEPAAELSARKMMEALDAEVERLPLAYRLPLLLCFWQGLSQQETARRLGWSPGSVKGRLERGRKRLMARLAQRGIAPAVLLVPCALAAPASLCARAAELSEASASIGHGIAALAADELQRRLPKLAALAMSLLLIGAITLTALRPGATPLMPDEPPAARKEIAAEPLPDGAIARLGSTRLRSIASSWILGLRASRRGRKRRRRSTSSANQPSRAFAAASLPPRRKPASASPCSSIRTTWASSPALTCGTRAPWNCWSRTRRRKRERT